MYVRASRFEETRNIQCRPYRLSVGRAPASLETVQLDL